MTPPTYATLIPAAIAWAAARGLLHPDGTANQATPAAQHRKTLEEIGEAKGALEVWQGTGNADARHALALELGDVLVTLVLQSTLQGVAWDECMRSSHRHGIGWGVDWHRSRGISDPPCTWQFAEYHASMLLVEIAMGTGSPDAVEYMGNVARCVEDIARIELAMSGPECLALAMAKIEARRGSVVGGVFVKAL